MRPVEEVALRALMYRDAYLNGRTGLDSIIEDQAVCPGELSFLALLAAESLTVKDWAALSALKRNGGAFLRMARECPDPRIAEVLLHAKPPRGVQSKQAWAAPFRGSRWDETEILMATLERSGTTRSHDGIEQTFSHAWHQITGGDIDAYLDACEQYEEVVA